MRRENENIRAGTCDYQGMRPPEHQSLNEYDQHIISETNTIYKYLSTFITVAIQAWNIHRHIQELNEKWDKAPQKVNYKICKNLTYPDQLKEDLVLGQYICEKSGHIPLIPVIDKCGHFFDYIVI